MKPRKPITDTQRMNWLANRRNHLLAVEMITNACWFMCSLRAAIDAAMRAQEEEKGKDAQ